MKIFIVPLLVLLIGIAAITASILPGEGKRLIQVNNSDAPKWLTETKIWEMIQSGAHFMDITDHPEPSVARKIQNTFEFPEELQYQVNVQAAYSKLNISRVEAFFNNYTAYYNRYYNSDRGAEASRWLYSQILDSYSKTDYPRPDLLTFAEFEHPEWPQKSIIVRIEGSDETLKNEIIILGAHLDSINRLDGLNGRAPGADDNASGSAVVLEAFAAIVNSGFVPRRTVEFHWYAAEEVGLRGSQAIASLYNEQQFNVIGMVNFDVVGYFADVRSIGISTGETNEDLNQFLRKVIDGYLEYNWIDRTCPFGCSDHASWNKFGYPAAFPRQGVSNPHMHTPEDDLNIVSFDQAQEFTKLALGFAIEVAQPAPNSRI